MRTIMVINAKGGSGKTTIATNLASYYASRGKKVVLADFDQQGSSMAWLKARSAGRPPIKGVAAFAETLRPGRGSDVIIMDAPAATHGTPLNQLVRRAHTFIIPVNPSPIDMRAAADFIKEIKDTGVISRKHGKIGLVANRGREVTNIFWELDEFLDHFRGVPYLAALRDSMNYIRAAERGLGIFEMAPYATAIDREQWQPLIKWLASKRSQA
ncbi:MAG: ParA family protein [Gammaproteobacteria bacterium]|nr:MAG: ParA family protein [Gammaproteobacteria bacterium]